MTVNVYDLANELERGIRSLPEYEAVLAAKARIDSDEEAQKLWAEYTQVQNRIQMAMQMGQMPSEDEQKDMAELGQRIEANAVLKNYFDQQQRLAIYIQDIEKIVFSPLQDLIK